jgi:nucleotide-binding universal stress UspA family protein
VLLASGGHGALQEVSDFTEPTRSFDRHERVIVVGLGEVGGAAREVVDDAGIETVTIDIDDREGVDVVERESADGVLLGWRGAAADGHVFGSTIGPVVKRSPCDVSLVEVRGDDAGTTVALAGPGPHAPVAARRAADFAAAGDDRPTLLNVQPPREDATDRGAAAVEWVAQRAGLSPDEYEARVVVAGDVESAILDAVADYDTVCVGLSERSDTSRLLFGSIAERISRDTAGNVAVVRGTDEPDRSAGEGRAPVVV